MADLTFDDIENGKWYVIPNLFINLPDESSIIYKTIYNGNYYIKSIAPTNQQDIVQVPGNVPIFREPDEDEVGEKLDDCDDKYDDDEDYVEMLTDNQLNNFKAFRIDGVHLTDEEKLHLYNKFIDIEKEYLIKLCQKGGRKRKTNKRKTNKRKTNKRKTNKRKSKGKKGNKKSSKRRTKR